MQAHQLKPARGSTHVKRRVGRGNASGVGTYSGRGLKGQKARAGNKPRRFFEGGQTRLLRKLPRKKGFHNPFRVEYAPVNLSVLNGFEAGTEVTPELLIEKRMLRNLNKPVKVGHGRDRPRLERDRAPVLLTAKEDQGCGRDIVGF